jgi:O-antigen ligase
MAVLYLAVLLVAMALSDLSNASLLSAAGQSVRGIDLLNVVAVSMAVLYLAGGGWARLTRAGRWFLLLAVWLVVCLALGGTRYGPSAIGEFRYVLPMFWFFVPPAVEMLRNTSPRVEYATVPRSVITLSCLAALLMLIIELAHGGRYFFAAANRDRLTGFADFRGTRYLDSYQTFSIMLASAASMLSAWRYRSLGFVTLSLGLLVAAFWTQNRTAVLAIVLAFVALALLQRRFALVGGLVAGGGIAIGIFALAAPETFARIQGSYLSALSPVADDSGTWRFLIQYSAFEQGMQTPVLGQGYGGYFRFELPGRADVLAPPHNQFLVFFLKGGIVAVALSLNMLLQFVRAFMRSRTQSGLNDPERLQVDILLVLVLSQFAYGVAYDFVVFLGLLLGCGEVLLQRQRARSTSPGQRRDEIPGGSLPIFSS